MAGISNGHVAARLALDREGRVKKVYVIESVLRRVLDEEAHRTFLAWTYTGSRYEWRTLGSTYEYSRSVARLTTITHASVTESSACESG